MTIYRVLVKGWEYKIEIGNTGMHVLSCSRVETVVPTRYKDMFIVTSGGKLFDVQIEKESATKNTKGANDSEKKLYAPMPGVVIKITVTKGDIVKKGDSIMTMESMKMQMELRAMVDGTIENIFVSINEKVSKGDLLLKIGNSMPVE